MSAMTLKRSGKIINKKYLEYFIPTVLIALANNIAIMVDSIIVGNMLGSVPMAAINVLSPVTQLYFSTTILFGLGASTLISFAKGRNDKSDADAVFTAASALLIIISAVFLVVQLIFVNNIAALLTPIKALRDELIKYYIPFIIGTPFALLLPSAVHCIRSDGLPKLASALIIISNAINLIMDLVLMGPFKMGIAGSAIATVIGNFVSFCIMIFHFAGKHNTLKLDLSIFSDMKRFLHKCLSLFTTGISGALGTMLVTVTSFYMNIAIQSAGGQEGMVSMSVISNCQIFISAFITGASQTMIPIVSTLLGERDNEGIRYALKFAIKVLLIASLTIILIIEIAPGGVALLFGDKTPKEMESIIPALRISALSFVGLAMSFLFMYYFTATQRKAMSLAVSIVNGIVLTIPSAYLLSRIFGINGLWMTFSAAQYGTCIFIAVMIFAVILKSKGKYKNIFLLEDQNEILSMSVSSSEAVADLKSSVEHVMKGNRGKAVADSIAQIFNIVSENDKSSLNDIRVMLDNGSYVVFVINNGKEIDAEKFDRISNNIEFSRVLGMNQIREII